MIDLLILIVIGVILGNMLQSKNVAGTKALFNGLGNIWGKSINGLLGK